MVFELDSHSWWVIKVIFAITTGCLTVSGAIIGFLIIDRGEPKSKIWFDRIWTKIDQSPFFKLPEICMDFLVNVKRSIIVSPFHRIINNKILLGLLLVEFLILIYLFWSQGINTNNPFFERSLEIFFRFYDWTQQILDSFFPSLPNFWKIGLLYVIASLSKVGGQSTEQEKISIWKLILSIPLFLLVQLPCYFILLYLTFALLYIVFFSAKIFLAIIFIAILNILLLSIKREEDKGMDTIFLIFTSINLTYLSFLLGDIFSVNLNDYQPRTLQALIVNTLSDFLTVYLTFTIFERLKNIKKKTLYLPIYVLVCIASSSLLCVVSLYFSLFKTDHAITINSCLNIFIGYTEDRRHIRLGSLFWFMHSSLIPILVYLLVVLLAWLAKINLLPIRWFFGRAAINEQPLKLTGAFLAIFIALFGLCTMISNELYTMAKGVEAEKLEKKISIIYYKNVIFTDRGVLAENLENVS